MPEWTEWPLAGNFRIRPKRRGPGIRTVLRRIAGAAGIALLFWVETAPVCGVIALPFLLAALLL